MHIAADLDIPILGAEVIDGAHYRPGSVWMRPGAATPAGGC